MIIHKKWIRRCRNDYNGCRTIALCQNGPQMYIRFSGVMTILYGPIYSVMTIPWCQDDPWCQAISRCHDDPLVS